MATRYWVGGTGTWTGTANWSATSGGASGASAPTNADTVIFDANSSSGSYTVTTSTSPSCQNLIMSGPASGILTFAGTNNLQFTSASGSHTLQILTPSTVNWTNTGSPQLTGAGTFIFDTNGCQIGGNIIIGGSMSSVTLNSNFSTTGSINFQSPSLVLNNNVMTVNGITFSAATSPNIAFGTGKIVTTNDYTGNAGLTVTGTPLIELASSGSTAILVSPVTTTLSPAISFKTTGAGTYALSIAGGTGVLNLDLSGHAGTLASGANSFTVYGNLTLSSSSSFSIVAGIGAITFGATSSKTITTNNKLIDRPVTFNGVGGTWVLQGAMTIGSTRTLTHSNGTLNLNGQTLTAASYVTATGTKNLTFNGGILTVTNSGATAFNNAVPTGFTTSAGVAKGYVYMTSGSAKTFVGGGSNYNATLVQAGAGALTVSGSNTFSNIKNTTQPAPVIFTSSTTNTFVDDFKLKGTNGSLIVITASTSGTAATVSHTGSNVSCDYISLKDNAATGATPFYAGAHSTITTNVTGWSNRPPPSANTDFLMFF